MNKSETKIAKTANVLRSMAEERLAKAHVSIGSLTDMDSVRLLHELQVHHMELEMQNSELQLSIEKATSDRKTIELLLEQSEITEKALNQSMVLLEVYNTTLERKVSEGIEELRVKDKMLLLQNRQAAIGEMINYIAHQWRQPLNELALRLQGLEMYYDSGELEKELLASIINNSMQTITYMSTTIEVFKNFFTKDKEAVLFNVNKTINDVVALVQDSLKHSGIKLDIVTQGELNIKGYPNEYAQVVLNIIMNAQDVLLEHKVQQPLITISSFMENDRSVVTIADNAGGIPEENIEMIFDLYFTTKGPDKGTGIGLYMAKTIIEQNMGGRLTVRNNIDGAEFRIEV